MPNRETHAAIGIGAGTAATIFVAWEEPNFEQFCYVIGGAVGGYFGSSFPDLLEPADNPNHRKFFHSIVFNGLLAGSLFISKILYSGARKIAKCGWDKMQTTENPIEKFFWWSCSVTVLVLAGAWTGMTVGYLSHVAADSMTAKSIPFLGIDF